MQKFQLYLFDFDGTLFDTLPSSQYVFLMAYQKLGISFDNDEVVKWTREPLPISYKKLGAPKDKYYDFIKDIDKLVTSQKSTDLTNIYDDTYDTIIDLKMVEADLGIVTSNNAIHVRDVLRKFDMQKDFFNVIVGNREAPTPKPHPEPILKALEMIDYHGDKKDVCYVGDSLNDCLSAVNAGIVPILLDRNDEFQDVPYQKIKSLKELID